jgi:aspartyl-tRNA(Asn)/glutamyl-tRNA(Gln) amidotransferase subunit A
MALSTADRELAFTPVHKLADMIRKKKLSPVELIEVILNRIRELNPKLNTYLTICEESAREGARNAEKALSKGVRLGSLHGIPASIKDLIATKDIRTTFGSLIYKDNVPTSEGTMVKRLKAAGAIIIGKTNTPEFGLCAQTENMLGDHCRNPWNLERTSGGSSGGAAAAAAGISPLTQGTDGGGSIRIPASYCGLYGLKPNFGRVPKDIASWGVSPVSCTGPMTWTVRDCALIMNVISGPDGHDYTCIRTPPPDFVEALDARPKKKLKIAWSPDLRYGQYGIKVDPEIKSAVEKAVQVFTELGHEVEEAAPDTGEPFDSWDVLMASMNYLPYGFALEKHADKIMDYNRLALECGKKLSGVDVAKTWLNIMRMRGVMVDFFAEYDLLLCPSTAVTAPVAGRRGWEFGRHFMDWAFAPFTCVFNLTLNPAASIPCGFSSDGLPIGLQIIGRLEDEVTILQTSASFEEARPWANKKSPIS